METLLEEAHRALRKAKLHFMGTNAVFLNHIMLSMVHELTDEVPTAATNGKCVKYNPAFLLSLNEKERVGLIAHECMHIALDHPTRKSDRDPMLFNIAGDFVINDFLLSSHFELPKGRLYDSKYHNMSTEQVYNLLAEDQENLEELIEEFSSKGQNDVEYSCETVSDDLSNDITNTVIQAVQQAQLSDAEGTVPAEVMRKITELLYPKISWKQLLKNYMDSYAKDDYSFRRPNKRFMPNHYMPSLYSESINRITVAIDTSGSVSQSMLTEMLTEIQYLYDIYQPTNLDVITCDYEIHDIFTLKDEITAEDLRGGGGTSFFPVLDHCKHNDTNILIYFTDLYAEEITPEMGYDFPILWICWSNHKPAKVGETIYYEAEYG